MASLATRVRGMWIAGQTVNATDLAKKLKCSSSTITMVRKNMEQEGFIFQATDRKVGAKIFVDHKLTAVPEEKKETKVPPRRNAAAAAQPSTNGSGPALPVLGQTLTVTLLAVDEHGTVSIGLREGKQSWLCELRGQTNS